MRPDEIELCAITGTFKGIPLHRIDIDEYCDNDDDMLDLEIVINMYNWEMLDMDMGTSTARLMLKGMGIKL